MYFLVADFNFSELSFAQWCLGLFFSGFTTTWRFTSQKGTLGQRRCSTSDGTEEQIISVWPKKQNVVAHGQFLSVRHHSLSHTSICLPKPKCPRMRLFWRGKTRLPAAKNQHRSPLWLDSPTPTVGNQIKTHHYSNWGSLCLCDNLALSLIPPLTTVLIGSRIRGLWTIQWHDNLHQQLNHTSPKLMQELW